MVDQNKIKNDIQNLIKTLNVRIEDMKKSSVRDEILSFIESDVSNDELIKIYDNVINEFEIEEEKGIYEEEDKEGEEEEKEIIKDEEEIDKKTIDRMNMMVTKNKVKKNDELFNKKKFDYGNNIGGKIAKDELNTINTEIIDFNDKENLITEKIMENPKEFMKVTKQYGLNISERGIELILSIIKGINSVHESVSNEKLNRNEENLYFVAIPDKNGKVVNYQPTVKFASLLLFFINGIKVEMLKVYDMVMADESIRIFVEVKITDKLYDREIIQIASEPVTIKYKNKTGEIIKEEQDYDKKVELAYSKAFRNGMVKLYGYWVDALVGMFLRKKK